MNRHGLRIAAFLVLAICASPAAGVLARMQEPARDTWQRVDDILQALGVAPGATVADVGAGGGYFTRRLAKAVGDDGRVYAVDVNPISLRELKENLGPSFTNVEIVRGDEHDPHLPDNALDAALVVNAYHEFADYRAMLERIRAALKPGGRLVLVEPRPHRADDTTRAAQTKRHTLAIEFAEQDLKEAGFEITRRVDEFAHRPEHQMTTNGKSETMKVVEWLIVGERR